MINEQENIKDLQETHTEFNVSEVLLEKHNIINTQNEIKKNIADMSKQLAGDASDIIDDIISKYTIEDIEKMSDDEVDKLLDVTADISQSALIEFKRDFIILNIKSNKILSDLDKSLEEIDTEIRTHQEDIESYIKEIGDPITLLRNTITKKMSSSEATELEKIEFDKALSYIDKAITLEPLKEYLNSFNGRYTRTNYINEKKSNMIYKKYIHLLGVHGLNIRFENKNFYNLEKKFLLDEKYLEKDNLFLYIIIEYISSLTREPKRPYQTTFILALYHYISSLFKNDMEEELKSEFIKNIKEVLDIIL
jgi:hypothetical protein